MRIFLTGGTGFIGQALVRAMRRRGWEVHALLRNPSSATAQWLTAQGATIAVGDVTQREGLREAMTGADVVIHNAGVYELGADASLRKRMEQVNVQGTDFVLGAARDAGVPRNVFVSTVWALGPTGRPPEPAVVADETKVHAGTYLTPYERSKAEAHQVALGYRARGLPLVIAMPNAVVGANDHSILGYFLRLYLLGAMPPIAWGGDAVYAMVDVSALAEGLCLAAEKATMGADYVFCGNPISIGDMFRLWGRYPGGFVPRISLPRWLMRPQMAAAEPLLRALDLPAFLSRDAVDASKAHLNYTAAKARRELGWTHPGIEEMWERIIGRERALIDQRHGFLNRLRQQPVVPD